MATEFRPVREAFGDAREAVRNAERVSFIRPLQIGENEQPYALVEITARTFGDEDGPQGRLVTEQVLYTAEELNRALTPASSFVSGQGEGQTNTFSPVPFPTPLGLARQAITGIINPALQAE